MRVLSPLWPNAKPPRSGAFFSAVVKTLRPARKTTEMLKDSLIYWITVEIWKCSSITRLYPFSSYRLRMEGGGVICLFDPQQLSTQSWILLHLLNQHGWSCVYICICMTVWLSAVFVEEVKCSSNMFQHVHDMWRDTETCDSSSPESSSSQALDICLTSYFFFFCHWLNSC